jgi:SAM-dependent methyltransferase
VAPWLAVIAHGGLCGAAAEIHLMSAPLRQHQAEIESNLRAWHAKPLLQQIYTGFYRRILELVDLSIPGQIVELGSGIGNLKAHLPQVITTDLFPNPWLDTVCDAYETPFAAGSLSHLVLFDVFHHLRAPGAFLREARRVLAPGGRVILFEPYISACSLPVYALLHHEPVAWRESISLAETPPPRDYYAAQGNATRLFFRKEISDWPAGWLAFHAKAFSCFHYLLSGGYSKPAFYPARCLEPFRQLDSWLSHWPKIFGGRCLIGLRPE